MSDDNRPTDRAKTVNEHQRLAMLGPDNDHGKLENDDHLANSQSTGSLDYVDLQFEPVSRSHHHGERLDSLNNQANAATKGHHEQLQTANPEVTETSLINKKLERNRQLSLASRHGSNSDIDKSDQSNHHLHRDSGIPVGSESNHGHDCAEDFNNNTSDEQDSFSPLNQSFNSTSQLSNLNSSSQVLHKRNPITAKATSCQGGSQAQEQEDVEQPFSLRIRKRLKKQMIGPLVNGVEESGDNNDGQQSKSNQHKDILKERRKSLPCPAVQNDIGYQDLSNHLPNKHNQLKKETLIERLFYPLKKALGKETEPPVRRLSKSEPTYELKECDQASKFSPALEGSDKSFTWPNEATLPATDQPNMMTDYGTNKKKVSLPRDYNGRERRRRSSQRRRSQPRLSEGSNAYTRLTYQNLKEKGDRSILQEFKRLILLLIIVAACALALWQIYLVLDQDSNYLGVTNSDSELGIFRDFAVTTDAKHCAEIGRNLLAKGGHAVDAAIGTLLCMGVVLPNSLGLGGGCLMTIYDNKAKQALVIDGREVAPSYAHETMFVNNTLAASRGPLSVGVPGELAAYWEAHQRYGRLNWRDLFTETIDKAEFGSPMVEHLAYALRDQAHAQYITPSLKSIFWNESSKSYFDEGDIVVQPKLAQSLKQIRDFGYDVFYNGALGQAFIEDLQKQGGKMTMDDLRSYRVLVKPALDVQIDPNLRLYTQPPPGSGVVLSVIMRIMKELGHFRDHAAHTSFESASLFYHHMVEAFKFAYAQRAALEDNPNDLRMKQLMAELLSAEFIKKAASKVTNQTHNSAYYGGLHYFQEDHGTAHTSVMDSEGNTIAVTTSVNLYFGSGMVSPNTGIVYNDVMDDFVSPGITNRFNLKPSKYNRIKPGRRPISSMAPSIFVDSEGRPVLALGASGGSKITTAVATVALRNTFLNEDIKMSIDASRIHHQYLPDEIIYEDNFPVEHLEALKDRGHVVKKISGRSSVVMGLACNYNNGSKTIAANSDYRKGGSVDGM